MDPVTENLIWFIGDNFTAWTYRAHFKKSNPDSWNHYIKEHYEFAAFCNSRYASANVNLLARIQNAFAAALSSEKKGKLPNYVLLVLDDDLISFLDFEHEGVVTQLGSWIEWLTKELNDLVKQRIDQLPIKCKKEVFFYWVQAPVHSSFSKVKNNLRVKFNLSLESVIHTVSNMRVVKLKEKWNPKDGSLVVNDRITEPGLTAYWNAIDATFKFNVQRHELFLAKNIASKHEQKDKIPSSAICDKCTSGPQGDPMLQFFRKCHVSYADRYTGGHEDCGSNRCRES